MSASTNSILSLEEETLTTRQETFTPLPWLPFDETPALMQDSAAFNLGVDFIEKELPVTRGETPLPFERVALAEETPTKEVVVLEDSFNFEMTLDYFAASPALTPALDTPNSFAFSIFEELTGQPFAHQPLQDFDAKSDFNYIFGDKLALEPTHSQASFTLNEDNAIDFNAFKADNVHFNDVYFPF